MIDAWMEASLPAYASPAISKIRLSFRGKQVVRERLILDSMLCQASKCAAARDVDRGCTSAVFAPCIGIYAPWSNDGPAEGECATACPGMWIATGTSHAIP
jgi:hypothetical protein